MSFMFSKNRKRTRTSTDGSNSSFVKKVTSRVSALLPAGITKWFSSPSSSSGNGSAAVGDSTDSSTDDETLESPSLPPAKRFRYSSPGRKYFQLTTSETTTTSNIVTESESVLYTSIQCPPGRHAYRREEEPNLVSTSIRSPIHKPEHLISPNTIVSSERQEYEQHSNQSITRKRKSLLDPVNRHTERSFAACANTGAHQANEYKQPYFKPHLLGSPFYPGRTMYGGASASSCYVSHPNIMQRKMARVNQSNIGDTVNMSSSSRQVMDVLENYSSPLIEAKRIPRYELSELTDINKTMPAVSRTSSHAFNSLKNRELHIPTKASLILMKARNRMMNSTKVARQIIASHSSSLLMRQQHSAAAALDEQDDPEYDSGQSKSSPKLKSRLTRKHCGGEPFQMPETVELPTAILRIDQNNMPTFTFNTDAVHQKTEGESKSLTFKFSNPMSGTSDAHNALSPAHAFNFGNPRTAAADESPTLYSFESREKTEPLPENRDISDIQTTTKTVIAFAKASSNEWKCSDCWVSNKADVQKCVCCGSKQPSKESNAGAVSTWKCTTCKHADSMPDKDKCVNCEQIRTFPKPSNPVATIKSSSKWKCGNCWVDNEENSEKCVCCGSKNPRRNTGKALAAAPMLTSAGAAPLDSDWRCEDCLITNKRNVVKCAACGGAKPGAPSPLPSANSASTSTITDDTFAQIVKSQKSSWECRVCLASNANENTACDCCETLKHGATHNAPKLNNFKFNIEPNVGFKFGIDPKVQEMNLAKKVDAAPVPIKPEESETNNNVVPKTASFLLPSKLPEGVVDISETNKTPIPSFSFGIPAQRSSLTTGFIPNEAPSATKLPDIQKPAHDKEKPQEVPSISFHAPETKQPPGWFASPVSTAKSENAMNEFLNSCMQKNKTTSPSKCTPTATENLKARCTFSASGESGTSSAGGVFSSQASAAVASTSAAPTGAPFSIATEASAAATPAAPSSLFQNTRGAPSAALSAPTIPIFSFGTSQSANPAPPTETTSKFSFSSMSTPAFAAQQATASTLPNGGGASNHLAQSISGNVNSGNGLASNGNAVLAGGASVFNTPAKESTMWPSGEPATVAHSFVTSTPAKPAFSFGAGMAPSPFGAPPPQPAHPMFGISQDGGAQPMFSTPQPAPTPAPPMFAAAPVSGSMFSATTAMASFDSPAPAFNFSGSQPASGVFGFGQQGTSQQVPQQQMQSMQSMQSMQPGAFEFAAPGAGQVQFAIGSAPNQGGAVPARRFRKAVRRNR